MVNFSLYGLSFSLVISFSVGILYCPSCTNDPTEKFYFGFARCPGGINSLGSIFYLLIFWLGIAAQCWGGISPAWNHPLLQAWCLISLGRTGRNKLHCCVTGLVGSFSKALLTKRAALQRSRGLHAGFSLLTWLEWSQRSAPCPCKQARAEAPCL